MFIVFMMKKYIIIVENMETGAGIFASETECPMQTHLWPGRWCCLLPAHPHSCLLPVCHLEPAGRGLQGDGL